jgi:hypothetical protein
VVHYDTTVDSVVSGSTVVDISGEGNNGSLTGDAAYSSTHRALVFDGTGDTVYNSVIPNWSDNISHTVSFFVKINSPTSAYAGSPYTIWNTASAANHYSASSLQTGVNGLISFYHFNNDYKYNYPLYAGTWYHIVYVYNGSPTTQKVYVNGASVALSSTAGTNVGNTLVLGTSPKLSLGGDHGRSNFYMNGSISNFKLYNVALTAEEVAMEYALGRTGKSLNLTDTSLCLGGTVPRAQLDVQGTAMFGNRVDIGTNTGTSDFNPTALTIHELSNSKTTPALTLNHAPFDAVYGSSWQLIDVTTDNLINRVRQCSVNLINYNTTGGGQGNFSGRRYTGMGFSVSNAQSGIQENALAIRYDGNVGIGTVNPAAKLDVNGYILNNNPAFHAYKTGGASTTNTGAFNAFTDVFLNRGGHYYTSGGNVGKFIAPVAGVYYFSANMLHRQAGANGSGEITFYKNGTNISSRAFGYTYVSAGSDHDNLHIETMIELAVNDYVQVAIHSLGSSTNFYYGEGLANFRGFLIG